MPEQRDAGDKPRMLDGEPTSELFDQLSSRLNDRYRLIRELGSGGMATVYLARDARHDRDVAIKVLRPELAAVIGGARFLAEIRTTAHLQHPNILPLFDSGEAGPFLYYVMPYVAGESLRDRLRRETQLAITDAIRVDLQARFFLNPSNDRILVDVRKDHYVQLSLQYRF